MLSLPGATSDGGCHNPVPHHEPCGFAPTPVFWASTRVGFAWMKRALADCPQAFTEEGWSWAEYQRLTTMAT